MAAPVGLHLEFRGGAELLFNGVKEQHVTLPSQSTPWDIRQLLIWIKNNLLKERPELFIQGDSVASWIINWRTETTSFLYQHCTAANETVCFCNLLNEKESDQKLL
ncbi:ubiquitin-related modifier 1 isoform X1 [Stegostoma tigrinum]|uniref:ubiquitin-related modifier 1 isoform X1 n=1 Tax=Stegostoma tigrinum TaxID=3053191 RepID=UPI00202B482F|nr:ubiquitin-related modifier 1 isoform X1 [Stegostoma tigrinum]